MTFSLADLANVVCPRDGISQRCEGRKHGLSEASYYLWRGKFGGMDASDAKRLKALEAHVAKTFLRNRQIMYGVPAGLPIRTELDEKARVYTSAPLATVTHLEL